MSLKTASDPDAAAPAAPDQEGIYTDVIVGADERATPPPPDGIISSQSKPLKQSGLFGASSNLVNSIVGAGIIGIPYAFKESGLLAGVVLLILVGWMTDKSLHIIVEGATFHPKFKHRDIHSFEDLMIYPYGRAGVYFILVNMFILAYGAMIAYLIIIKDTIPVLIGLDNSTAEKNMVMFVTAVIIILPLALQRDMATLAFTSTLSVSADVILTAFVAGFSPISRTLEEAGGFWKVLESNWINSSLFVGLGILSTAMACQHAAFIISGSLSNITKRRWAIVTCNSLTLSTLMCLILGVCGYLGFLQNTDGDILNNFPDESVQANGARALLAITMFFTYPMESFVARHIFMKLFFNGDMDGPLDETTGKPQGEFCCGCLGRRHAVTLGIFTITMIPGLALSSLGSVLSITGSIGGSCLAYIAPGLVYLGINGEDFLQRAAASCGKSSSSSSNTTSTTPDLPADGDAERKMQVEEPVLAYPTGTKPWWWYPTLMPIWCSLAITGTEQTNDRLQRQEELFQEMAASPHAIPRPPPPEEEINPPTVGDYCVAIFFIVFGLVAAVAGVVSNIYS